MLDRLLFLVLYDAKLSQKRGNQMEDCLTYRFLAEQIGDTAIDLQGRFHLVLYISDPARRPFFLSHQMYNLSQSCHGSSSLTPSPLSRAFDIGRTGRDTGTVA